MTCDRCGRLLNRATGRCVCDDYAGAAPAPVSLATTPAPAPAPAPAAPPLVAPPAPAFAPPPPISMAAAVAVLDLSDRPNRPSPPPRPPEPAPPAPPPRVAGAPVGCVRGARNGRRSRVDVVFYDGRIVIARRGASADLLAPQLAAQDPSSRLVEAGHVEDVVVREDAVGGRAAIDLRNGERIVLRWSGRRGRGLSVEDLLASAFPGKVEQGPSEVVARTVRFMATAGVAVLVLVGAWLGLSALLKPGPPPPPPPAPPVTLPATEQAARAALGPACGSWVGFASTLPRGERPDPRVVRPLADGIKPAFDQAAGAVAHYAPARDEVAYLQQYSRRAPDDVARESSSRVTYAVETVSAACGRATAAA